MPFIINNDELNFIYSLIFCVFSFKPVNLKIRFRVCVCVLPCLLVRPVCPPCETLVMTRSLKRSSDLGASSSFHNINWQTGDALHRSLLVDATITVTVSLCYYYYYDDDYYHRHEAKIRTCLTLLFLFRLSTCLRSAAKGERPKSKKKKLMTAVKRNTGAQSHINVSDDSVALLLLFTKSMRLKARSNKKKRDENKIK